MTTLQQYKDACVYPGKLDGDAVETHLGRYLEALGLQRNIVRIRRGWTLSDYPPLDRTISTILGNLHKRIDARAALDALDARDALDVLAARAARDARAALYARDARDARDAPDVLDVLDRFASGCIFGSGWGSWDLSWVATTYLGAKKLNNDVVMEWSKPIFDAFVAGCWQVFWTEETLYWVAKPIVHIDDKLRIHREDGPAFICDAEDMYFWHGVMVPRKWIEDRDNLDPSEIILASDVELRAAGAAICGWRKMLSVLNERVIDQHPNPAIGSLIELTLPGLDEPGRFLKAECPRNGTICEGVPYVSDIDGMPIETAIAAQAWRLGDAAEDYQISPIRT